MLQFGWMKLGGYDVEVEVEVELELEPIIFVFDVHEVVSPSTSTSNLIKNDGMNFLVKPMEVRRK